MTKNMGTLDRVIRTLIAVAVIVLYVTGKISGTLAIVLGIVAIAFLVTSLVGWCPSYVPFGLSTRKTPAALARISVSAARRRSPEVRLRGAPPARRALA
jgi:hypothetical protein